ncbi:hypothetical protein PoB_004050900 [Plakobranchus ocellatus]|uniref:Uncharacterized protein n=1 Tax=Plakobranchus ocellatus TaxID=259542 RepID=A0AAV4B5N3_9GAST|nr:hypothetical protein PoB_004050900 [Plakobranchus ocellatus]
MREFGRFRGSPPATESNQEDKLRGTPARCQGYPGAIINSQQRVAPHGKQSADTVGVGLSIIPSTGELRWI